MSSIQPANDVFHVCYKREVRFTKIVQFIPNMKLLTILITLCYVHYCRACNGYTLKVTKFKNCIDNSVVKLSDDFGVILDKDCNFYTNGCIEITKNFKTAMGKYSISKPPLPLIEGDFDLCQVSDLLKPVPDIVTGIEAVGFPIKCPVDAKKICGGPEHSMNLSKFKSRIGMAAGNSEIKFEIEHDTGKSCFEIHATISKARRG